MARKITSSSQRKLNSQQVALTWLKRGIQPVPLKPKAKRPKSGQGWNSLLVDEDTIPEHFSAGDNVGGLWGKASEWIVDIDLDWDEACEVAVHILPETFIYGRKKRPNSHYLYRCIEVSSSKRTLKDGSVIAEIRSTGSQSVLPPSIHPEGDRYVINHDVEIVEIPRAKLQKLINEVAGAAVLIRNFPSEGSRHDYIHALTGALMWSGWTEPQTRKFLSAILEAISNLDDDLDQRKRTIDNTLEHFKNGDHVAGWKTLATWIDNRTIQSLRQWLAPKKQYELPPEPRKEDLHLDVIPKFDPKLLEVEGLVGDLAQWCSRMSYLKQPSFDLATGLMCTALASANKYLVQGWETPLQPYFMLVAPTSAGKGASLEAVYRFAKTVGFQDFVHRGFQSYYALLDQLAENPNMACWLWDEAARHLASSRSPNSIDYTVISHLISLYGQANSFVPGTPGRKNAIPPLDNPFLTLFATAQPDLLIEAISTSTVATGFINRIVLFDSGDSPADSNIERESLFPSALKKTAIRIKQHEPRNNKTLIRFDSATYAHFRDFDTHSRGVAARGEENGIWGRANQNALLLAGLVAVGQNPDRPYITLDVAEWASALVQWSIGCWMTRIGETASRSRRESQSKRIESLIRRTKSLVYRAGTNKQSKKYINLMKTGQMPRAVLQRLSRDMNKRDLDDILDQLLEADLIGMTEDDSGLVTFWPRH